MSQSDKEILTTKRRIVIVLFVIWGGLIGYAIFGVHTDTVTAIQAGSPTLNINGKPVVTAHSVFTFVATGSISVGNPITVTVNVYQTEGANFLQNVAGITFTGSYNVTRTGLEGVSFKTAYLPFHQTGNGTY